MSVQRLPANVKRKWKQAVDFQGLGSDEQLDEAYMDELEQQVLLEIKLFSYSALQLE